MAEERTQRRFAAILAADVVGYSRLMEVDEAATLAVLKARWRDVLDPLVAKNMVMAGGFLYVIAFGASALSFDNGWTKATSASS